VLDYITGKNYDKFCKRYKSSVSVSQVDWHINNIKNNLKLNFDKLLILVREIFNPNIRATNLDELIDKLLKVEISPEDYESEKKITMRYNIMRLADIDSNTVLVGKTSNRHYSVITLVNSILRYCL